MEYELSRLQMKCCDTEIDFITDVNEVYDSILSGGMLAPDSVPGVSVCNTDHRGNSNGRFIKYLESDEVSTDIDVNKNRATICAPKQNLFIPDISFLALSMFAKEMNEYDKYFIHSAVVEKDGKATLLAGDGGSGKTTLGLYLCMQKGYRLISDDRTIIGNENESLKVFAGTKEANIRVGTAKAFFPTVLNEISEEQQARPWQNKISISDYFCKLGIETSNTADISNIIFTQTYPVEAVNTTMMKQRVDESMINVMGSVSEHIRANRNVLLSTNYPFPSFDTTELAEKRMRFVERIIGNCAVYTARGNIAELADRINEL